MITHVRGIVAEASVPDYLDRVAEVFRALRRVVNPAGTAWVHVTDALYAGRGRGKPEPRAGSPGRRRRGRTAQDAAGDSLARRARARGDGMDGPGRRAPSCAHGRPSTPRTGRTARPTRCSCWPGGRHYRYRAVQMPNEPASDVWAISPPKGWRRTRAVLRGDTQALPPAGGHRGAGPR